MSKKIDVTVAEELESHRKGALTYAHPSYGMLSISRIQGKTELFGSDIKHDGYFELRISGANVTSHLGQSWYHDTKQLISIKLSSSQFVDIMSHMNTQGVPCTIHKHPEHGAIEYSKPVSQLEYASNYAHETGEQAKVLSDELVLRTKALLSGKGALKVSEKEELLRLVNSIQSSCHGNIKFAVDQAEEAIDKMKSQAMVEVDSRLHHTITSTGLEVLRNPELLNKLLENKQ